MGVLRCKMCGAPIETIDNNRLVTCNYCGSKQTIIDANDEKKTNLFNRANQLRMNCDFDSAIVAYESIISLYPQEPEAYWGLALSKFGIEYVDDPKTKKKTPTIHRSSYEYFEKDSNYLRALEYSDIIAKEQYKNEAIEITNIQKSILNISKNEKPFDIFICYKEKDSDGKRTRDSVIGQELHQLLTEKGYKVFFSRVTLEHKLGTMYEPYIFAALNSAKIMIVIGTKKEYFTATWVKNEWSRFLSLMQGKGDKYIIPCFRDMDAYEMPEELLGFQAQDLNKLGFVQDLMRGINKLIGKEDNKPSTRVVHTDVHIEPMLQRAEILIQDKDYTKADEVLEKILNNDPRNSDAYLLKSVIFYNKTSIEDLKMSIEEPNDSNFKRAYQFADDERKAFLDSIISAIQERKKEEEINKKYNEAIEYKNVGNYSLAIEIFSSISSYKDSSLHAKECSNLISENKYKEASEFFKTGNYVYAIPLFRELRDYKDSKLKLEQSENIINEEKYQEVKKLLSVGNFKDAKDLLYIIEKYKDSAAILNNIDNLQHEYECEQIYNSAIIKREIDPYNDLYKIKKSLEQFIKIPNYKNVSELIPLYESYYQEGLQIYKLRKEESLRKRKIRNRKIKIGSIISAILVFIITVTLLSTFLYFVPSANESKLIDLVSEGKYNEALTFYNELDNISQNFGKIDHLNNLSKAGIAMDSRDYETALEFMDYADVETKVHYNGNGGTVDSEIQVFKQYINTTPDKRGYDFQGWDLVDFKIDASNLTAEMWLDATYDLINYSITYIMGDPSIKNNPNNPNSYTVNDEITLKDPTREGYTFRYWVDQYGNEIRNVIKKGTIGDIVLKPVWNTGNKYIITLDPNGGELENNSVVVWYTQPYSLPVLERKGYEFRGWYFEEENKIIDNSGYWSYTRDVTLVAKWSAIKYSITYNLNGGTNNSLNPEWYTIEDEIILLNPFKSGYTFLGWYCEKNLTKKINIGSIGDIHLEAKWTPNQNGLFILSEDESYGLVRIISGTGYTDEMITIEAIPLEGYWFEGWYNQEEKVSDSKIYTFKMPDNDFTLIARFIINIEEYVSAPRISEDKKTLTYGIYPQTHVNDIETIEALNIITETNSSDIYFYNNSYYQKSIVKLNEYNNPCYFSDGTQAIEGNVCWFKCEPIIWDILSITNETQYSLVAHNVLDFQIFNEYDISDPKQYNNYENSYIREWLNQDFYDIAFSFGNNYIETTFVDNSPSTTSFPAIDGYSYNNTEDKVFLLSAIDYMDENVFSSNSFNYPSLRCSASDFVVAKGCFCYSKKIDENFYNFTHYFTRSPSEFNIKVVEVFLNRPLSSGYVDFLGGIRPSITLNTSN